MLIEFFTICSCFLLSYLFFPFKGKNFSSQLLLFLSSCSSLLLLSVLVYQGQQVPAEMLGIVNICTFTLLAIAASFRFIPRKLASMGLSIFILSLSLLWWNGYLQPAVHFAKQYHIKIGTTDVPLWAFFQSILVLFVSIAGALLASRKLETFIEGFSIHASMKILFMKCFKVVIFSVSLLWGLSLIGVDISVFAFLGGAIALGLGFGLQNIVSNLLCGIILLIDKSIKPGDVIALKDGSVTGVIHKLTARYVTLRTQEGKEHLIPNDHFVSNKVENWSHTDRKIRIPLSLRVPFESDLDKIEKLLHGVALKENRVLKNPGPSVRYSRLVDNAIEVQLRVWIADPEKGVSEIVSNLIYLIWKVFREEDIHIPSPHLDISVDLPKIRLKEITLP